MADLACVYTLTTTGGTVRFNDGNLHTTDDLYWISTIQGLDGAPIRAPIDPAPQAHGGLIHRFWRGPRQITMEGSILVQSIRWGGACLTVRNSMEGALKAALESTHDDLTATLAWTPTGGSPVSILVRNNVPVEYVPQEGYMIVGFTFGLASADPDF